MPKSWNRVSGETLTFLRISGRHHDPQSLFLANAPQADGELATLRLPVSPDGVFSVLLFRESSLAQLARLLVATFLRGGELSFQDGSAHAHDGTMIFRKEYSCSVNRVLWDESKDGSTTTVCGLCPLHPSNKA